MSSYHPNAELGLEAARPTAENLPAPMPRCPVAPAWLRPGSLRGRLCYIGPVERQSVSRESDLNETAPSQTTMAPRSSGHGGRLSHAGLRPAPRLVDPSRA